MVGVVLPLARKRLRLPPVVTAAVAWQTPLAVSLALPRGRARDASVYAAQMWAYLVSFELPSDDFDEQVRRARVRYPIAGDRAIGLGQVPTVRLQRALMREGEIQRLDLTLSIVHWAWFGWPHGALLYILVRHPARFGRSAALVGAAFDAGAAIHHVIPTAPPWWAGGTGDLPPVRRILIEAGQHYIPRRLWNWLYDSLSTNQLAAMPSLHFASSVMVAHVLSDSGRVAGVVGWTYAASLGFALVYLGEHYVVDLVAGMVLVESVRRLEPLAHRPARELTRFVRRWEPVSW